MAANNSTKAIWITIGVIVVGVGIFFSIKYIDRQENKHSQSVAVKLPPPSKPTNVVNAPAGQLVAGFPPGMVFSNAAITNSYNLQYQSNLSQYTAQVEYTGTLANISQQYQTYLKSQGYTINVASQIAGPPYVSIQGTGQNSSVNIVLLPESKQVQASITYLQK